MEKNEYSAACVSQNFWFLEFKKAVQMIMDGISLKDIKKLSKTKNIFGAISPARANDTCRTVCARIADLDESFLFVFKNGDLNTQKLINLISIMIGNTLFFEFVYEIIREKIILGTNEFEDSDMRVFFNNKQVQNEKCAQWTDITVNRLCRTYKNWLVESGIINQSRGTKRISAPIMEPELVEWLKIHDYEPIYKALTGEY